MNNLPREQVSQDGQGNGSQAKLTFITAAHTSRVTYILIAVTILVFIAQVVIINQTGVDLVSRSLAKINENVAMGEYWRVVTPLFIHGSLLHLAFNVYSLFLLGRAMEGHYGHVRFLILYLLGGMSGYIVSLWMTPSPSYGAASGLFGVLAGEAVFIFQNRFLFGNRLRSILFNIGLLLVVNLGMSIFLQLDVWGLVGGIMGGIAFSWLGGPLYGVLGKPPNLVVSDQRPTNEVWMVALFVFVSLVVLTGVWTFFK
jgi:rhomboid protease GluP